MVKQVRGLLNKLSPENFDKLKDKFLFSCKYFSAMTAVCELLVRKSYDEPKYASLYAKLTHYFYTNLPLPPGIQDTPEQRKQYSATVRRFIIVACQNQFLARPDWAEKAAGKITEEEYEEVVKIKSKALGNMKFVGELYVSGIINPKVMILIVSSLISEKTPAPEDIECVLMLLNTMGPHADAVLGTALCDPWYEILTEIYHRSELISRIKFAIADLLDLRAARWARQWVQPGQGLDVRGKQVMAFSAEEKISSMSRQSSARGSTRGGPSRQNSVAGADANNDGWSPASSSSGRRRDPNRFNSTGGNSSERGAGGQQAGDRRRGKSPSAPSAAKKPVNVFDLLHGVGEQESSEEEDEDEGASEEANEEAAAEPKVADELTADPEEATPAAPVELSDDEVDAKAKAIMRNLFSSREASEWVDDVKKVANYTKQLVAKSLDIVSQEKVAEATLFGKSLALGVQEGVFSLGELVQFIVEAEVIEFYADVKTDVPQLDSLMVALLKEVAKAGDAAAVDPVLKATGIAEL
ncbi:armadillo-type protein [Catenaria anguillulae PL171]|uniref:Armadillo-type protein n=1 Tax=Catenaria anguillulae PL171 TaxID=765915 RepID=A0A1Y2I3Z0_9FUNG|nr:armadillo-type protein [Catenaria anguillulae PL171]